MAQSKGHKRSTRVLAKAEFSSQQDEHQKELETTTTTTTTSNMSNSNTMVMSSVGGGTAIRRVRTPHEHDVLSGRGGGINAHLGNVQFRLWVRERKNDYTLASNKTEKARVAQEVIDIVRGQDPPGRFLQKDPSFGGLGGWWVELDEEKTMAKTSQALREGAPQIRAAHNKYDTTAIENPPSTLSATAAPSSSSSQQQPQYIASISAPTSPLLSSGGRKTTKRYVDPDICVSTLTKPDEAAMTARQEMAMAELRANVEQARAYNDNNNIINNYDSLHHLTMPPLGTEEEEDKKKQQKSGAHVQQYSPFKRVRVEYGGRVVHPSESTPPLTSADAAAEMIQVPTLDLSKVERPSKKYRRSHSLALSDVSLVEDQLAVEEFVNPFEDEQFFLTSPAPSPPKVETTMMLSLPYQQPNNHHHHHLGTVPLDTFHHASSAESSSSAQARLGIYRNPSSTTSNGDLAGLRALMQPNNHSNSSRSLSVSSLNSGVRGNSNSKGGVKLERRDSLHSATSSNGENRGPEELDLTDPLHYFFCHTPRGGSYGIPAT